MVKRAAGSVLLLPNASRSRSSMRSSAFRGRFVPPTAHETALAMIGC
jgi:hypothetical protein